MEILKIIRKKYGFIFIYFLLIILIGNCNKKANEIPLDNIQAHRIYQNSKLSNNINNELIDEYLDLYFKDSTNPYIYYYLSRLDWPEKNQYLVKGLSKFPDDIFLNFCKIKNDTISSDQLNKWLSFYNKYPFFNYSIPYLLGAYSKEISKMGNVTTLEQFEKMKDYLDSINLYVSKYVSNVKEGKKIKLFGYKSKYYDFSNFEVFNDSTNYSYYTSKESIKFQDSIRQEVIARIVLIKYLKLLDLLEFDLVDGFSEPVLVGGNSYDGTVDGKLYFGGRNLNFHKKYPYWSNQDMYLVYSDRPDWQLESGKIKDCEIKLDAIATFGKNFSSNWVSNDGISTGKCEILPITSDKRKGKLIFYRMYSDKWSVWGYREVSEEIFQEFAKLLNDLYPYNDALNSVGAIP